MSAGVSVKGPCERCAGTGVQITYDASTGTYHDGEPCDHAVTFASEEQALDALADVVRELDRADDDAALTNERLRELAIIVRAATEAW